jgi:RNA polymerase sigma-70 factor (ECF subfamily)
VPDPLLPLLLAAREGDDAALSELVRRTQPAIWRLCSSLGSGHDVEDLVQDTYLRALRSLGSFRAESPVLPWLLTIGRRACADQVRRRQRHRRLTERLERTADRSPDAGPGVPVDDVLDHLDADRRDAFVLTQLAGLRYDEAAAVLGCPIGTVRSRVARARADLLALLVDHGAAGTRTA